MLTHILATGRWLRTRITLARSSAIKQAGPGLHVGARSKFWAPEAITIGKSVYIGKDVLIECNAELGDCVLIANRVAFVGRNDHDYRAVGVPIRFSPWIGSSSPPSPYRQEKVVVESDTWIGFAAVVLSGTRIARGAIVAAGAVVSRDVPPYAIVAGNPATVVGQRFPDEIIPIHEARIRDGYFEFSERGYEHWIVEPSINTGIENTFRELS